MALPFSGRLIRLLSADSPLGGQSFGLSQMPAFLRIWGSSSPVPCRLQPVEEDIGANRGQMALYSWLPMRFRLETLQQSGGLRYSGFGACGQVQRPGLGEGRWLWRTAL